MKSGIFIVIDGMDGSGKSEMIQLLHNHLYAKDRRYRILSTREPTHGVFGKKLRDMLNSDRDPLQHGNEMLDLFVKDRAEHLQLVIEPFLRSVQGENKNIVLCDRYYYSTVAFQSVQGIDLKKIITANKEFRKPDIAIILDLDPRIALKRIGSRKKEKFETVDFMASLRKRFVELPKLLNEKIHIVDAGRSKEAVFSEIKNVVEKELDD